MQTLIKELKEKIDNAFSAEKERIILLNNAIVLYKSYITRFLIEKSNVSFSESAKDMINEINALSEEKESETEKRLNGASQMINKQKEEQCQNSVDDINYLMDEVFEALKTEVRQPRLNGTNLKDLKEFKNRIIESKIEFGKRCADLRKYFLASDFLQQKTKELAFKIIKNIGDKEFGAGKVISCNFENENGTLEAQLGTEKANVVKSLLGEAIMNELYKKLSGKEWNEKFINNITHAEKHDDREKVIHRRIKAEEGAKFSEKVQKITTEEINKYARLKSDYKIKTQIVDGLIESNKNFIECMLGYMSKQKVYNLAEVTACEECVDAALSKMSNVTKTQVKIISKQLELLKQK